MMQLNMMQHQQVLQQSVKVKNDFKIGQLKPKDNNNEEPLWHCPWKLLIVMDAVDV